MLKGSARLDTCHFADRSLAAVLTLIGGMFLAASPIPRMQQLSLHEVDFSHENIYMQQTDFMVSTVEI